MGTRFRKKPVEVTAKQLVDEEAVLKASVWLDAAAQAHTLPTDCSHLIIHTLEGDMRADMGDWVIRGVKGEFYPCKPDVFAASCEEL